MHDDAMKEKGQSKSVQMNFKEDGNRIVYEDAAANAAAGRGLEMLGACSVTRHSFSFVFSVSKEITLYLRILTSLFLLPHCAALCSGGGASSVVPALSVINIKVRFLNCATQ